MKIHALLVMFLASPVLAASPGDALVEEGERKLQSGDDAGAVAAFERAAALAPRDPRPRFLRGAALAHQGKKEAAVQAYNEALKIDPRLPEVHNELGIALQDLGRTDQAIGEFKTAAEQNASLGEAWLNWERALLRKKAPAEAVEVLKRAVVALPRDMELRVDMVTALRDAKRHPESVTAAREAVKLAPGSAGAHYSLGRSLQLVHQLDEAVKELEIAERLKPGPAMTAALASALREKGDLKRAEALLRAAIAKTPRSLVAHSELAQVLAAAHKCPEAQAELASLPADKEAVAEARHVVAAACPSAPAKK